jgi:hypothetical protein
MSVVCISSRSKYADQVDQPVFSASCIDRRWISEAGSAGVRLDVGMGTVRGADPFFIGASSSACGNTTNYERGRESKRHMSARGRGTYPLNVDC